MSAFVFVIFGVSSNLAQIKLIPALADLESHGLLPKDTKIIGISRTKDDEWLKKYLQDTLNKKDPVVVSRLIKKFEFFPGDINSSQLYKDLKSHLKKYNNKLKVFYLATYPNLYSSIFPNLPHSKNTRIVLEKPIGTDLKSAKILNKLLSKYFTQDQIYRLDHYLGKETVQNILTFRFGNSIFEPLINKDFIDCIQITSAEEFGIGLRGGYYDTVGALKDVGQNHLLQLLTLACMDSPTEYISSSINTSRIKILSSLVANPKNLVLGQYQGYLREKNVEPNSKTETFFALKTYINNERFKGVPIYIRAGKRLPESVTEISYIFKLPTNRLFKQMPHAHIPNVLTLRIQPNEGIVLQVLTKKPDMEFKLDPNSMQFCYRDKKALIDPYVRLILDILKGDQTFFNDSKEIEAQWQFIDNLIKKPHPTHLYKPSSWGPKEARDLIKRDNREWLDPNINLCQL